MNGDVICNGQSSMCDYRSPSKSCTPLRDGNSVSLNYDVTCAGKHAAHSETQAYGEARRREESRLGPPSLPHSTAAYSHSVPGPTPGSNRTSFPTQRAESRKAKVKRATQRAVESKNSQNRKVTDFYPIRRSSRKCKTELKCEEKKHIDKLIQSGIEEGMKVENIEGKGRGVFATEGFRKGQFVVEYYGDLLQITDAKEKEAQYAQDPSTGCYMYYFQYLSKTYCVDATKETGRMGRLINHSKNGNCQTKLHDINGIPHLILVASRDIDKGEELLYDYGDRSKASIAAHPWLKH
ncbi:hypothetical protein AGOR_G00245680 [Albula goreensis]|uniref:[histone H4]-lysine(20) N-methyltransferase n=1 Tax=Albula goreensis TaxID=1534307 RepID=A0A8T3CD45_9TELE|nr:hypothetical protein AGOR_G00245680 [Albula goreensis]